MIDLWGQDGEKSSAAPAASAARALPGKTVRDVIALQNLPLPKKDRRVGQWYVIHPELFHKAAAGIPGVTFTSQGFPIVHRTHLPWLRIARADIQISEPSADLISDLAFDQETAKNNWQLRGYQHAARRFLRERGRCILGDQMRMGKSPSTLAAVDLSDGPLLILAPLAVRGVWMNWAKRRWPDILPAKLEGKAFDVGALQDSPVTFLHYEVAREWQSVRARKIGTVILDEVHVLSNRKSTWTQAASYIATQSERVYALTGTPLWNKPQGLWSLLHAITPGAWGQFGQFAERYAGMIPGPYGPMFTDPTNTEELRWRMTEMMLRRTWQDVQSELPAIDRSVETVPITAKMRREIDICVESLSGETDVRTYAGKLARYRRAVGKHKLERSVDLAQEILTGGEPCVVWCWHKDWAEELAKEIGKKHQAFWISGKQTQTQREQIIDKWRESGAAVLISTMAVGQMGIDLSHARHCIFTELDWTPAVIAQAEMRTFAIARPMTVTYIVVDHDADQQIIAALTNKLMVADRLNIPAADAAIGVITSAFGTPDVPDMDRLLAAVLAGDDGSEDLL